ncbi:MAG TPA: type II toxin-antitoxin system RelE/ParE family toxin [Candidatus Saccharimonadales bacterium]|nr:type II toxin-antitoxin system RelE/ParE family toxin [Candidatus Saccharimonadales bacterium]
MNVIFSAKADQDLASLFNYINENLHNDIAARNIVDKILRLSQKLSAFPEMGSSLKLKTIDDRLDGYRYLIADNYLLIYKVMDEEVAIVRILYAKSDYVQLLRG